MIIYSVWNCDSCDCEYFKTKESAQARGKEILEGLLLQFSVPEDKFEEIYDRFYKEDDAYYYGTICGIETKIALVAIDKIVVKD